MSTARRRRAVAGEHREHRGPGHQQQEGAKLSAIARRARHDADRRRRRGRRRPVPQRTSRHRSRRQVHRPLREGAARAVRRVRAVSRAARAVRRTRWPSATRSVGGDPVPSCRTPAGTFGVSESWEVFFPDRARAADRARRRGAAEPHERRRVPRLHGAEASRWRRHGCARSRRAGGSCRRRRRGSRRSSRRTATVVAAHRHQRAASCSRAPSSGGPVRRWAHERRRRPALAARLRAGGARLAGAGPSNRDRSGLEEDGDGAVVDERDVPSRRGSGRSRTARAEVAQLGRRPASTSGSACSGRAAAIHDGRRPRDGVAVERELADDEHLAAGVERPTGSSRRRRRPCTRRCQILPASSVASASPSSWVTPTRTHSPAPMAPTTASPTVTRASRHPLHHGTHGMRDGRS